MKNLNKPLYSLKNSQDKQLNKRFYPEEIQRIKYNNIFRVEKILKEGKINNKKYYFVKWTNHNSSENSWVLSTDIFNINNGK